MGALPGLDLDALTAHLTTTCPGLLTGPLRGAVIPGGKSNLTYLLGDGTARWVLRRPPLGHVLATAHDMSREYRVITALAATEVPVPGTVLLCADPSVIGAPFYLMDRVDGRPLRDPGDLALFAPAEVRLLVFSLVDTLARLHAVDPAVVGLADFGRPEGFNERQVRRWKTQLDGSRSRDLPGIDELHRRLAAAVPDTSTVAIVHGDYRLDNVLVGAGALGSTGGVVAPRITAVLDWEMSTLGDPLGDLALLLLYSGLPLPTDKNSAATGSARPATMLGVVGHPGIDELTRRYAERSGRDLTRLRWYRAFAAFKLAAIAEGVHYRFQRGQTVGRGFSGIGGIVEPLVADGLAVLDGTQGDGRDRAAGGSTGSGGGTRAVGTR